MNVLFLGFSELDKERIKVRELQDTVDLLKRREQTLVAEVETLKKQLALEQKKSKSLLASSSGKGLSF